MINTQGLCKECNDNKVKRLISKRLGLCQYHYRMHTQSNKKGSAIKKCSKKKELVTQRDIEFFQKIWDTRPHQSEISGHELGDDFNVVFFSHILTKAAYPKFRWTDYNVMLMTFEEHQQWEFGSRSDQKWETANKRAEELKQIYYKYMVGYTREK